MTDLAIVEANGNGGDLVLKGNDLAMQGGWGNMPYLALFGGNIEAVTKERIIGEEAKDWWGNALLMPQDTSIQFNSTTERILNEVALNSAGRIRIEQEVKSDLLFMKDFAEIEVSVSFPGIDKVKIVVKILQPENLANRIPDIYRQFIFIWDATLKQLGDYRISDYNDDYNV